MVKNIFLKFKKLSFLKSLYIFIKRNIEHVKSYTYK